jgi:hypothetical protein
LILDDLVKSGWRLAWIAEAIGAAPNTVNDWYNKGKRPTHRYAQALLELKERVLPLVPDTELDTPSGNK